MRKQVTVVYWVGADRVSYGVLLDDQALAELIVEADRLAEESSDRNGE